MGVYNNTIQYQVNNWVTYTVQGVTQLYICIVQPPLGTAPTNTNYWRTFTVQGEQGASGTHTVKCFDAINKAEVYVFL